MPANLPPTYHEAEARYRAAAEPKDKIAALEEMLRIMPKHKGTDKLQADIKSRISKLRKAPKKKASSKSHGFHVGKEGAGQIALAGPPNSGKSSLVDRLTHAKPEVAPFPFATREPCPGMMPYLDISIQLVDLPPLSAEYVEPWVYDIIRLADLVWLVVDVADSLDGFEQSRGLLEGRNIGIFPAGDEGPEIESLSRAEKPALLVVTGLDRVETGERLEILRELLEEEWPVLPVSSTSGAGLDDLARRSFEALEIVRVYTKQPGKPPDMDEPFTLRRGATVGDLARSIHKEILEGIKFARVWGADVFDGQTVQREHELADGDVVEIHV